VPRDEARLRRILGRRLRCSQSRGVHDPIVRYQGLQNHCEKSAMETYPRAWRMAVEASFLGRLPEKTRAELLCQAREVTIEAKSVIYHESGNPHLVLVLDGLVRVYRTSSFGREVNIRYVRAGEVMGLPSIVTGTSPAAAQAIVATRVVKMSVPLLQARARRDNVVGWVVAEEVASSLFNVQERLAHNVFAPIRARVARFLLDVAVEDRATGRIVATTSHQEVAAAIGTVREVVARTLRTFRSEGLTETSSAGIVLTDIEAMLRVADPDEAIENITSSARRAGRRSSGQSIAS
jgi:CRP/FNR family transcriptional regulator, cyclic AMP receptor protein